MSDNKGKVDDKGSAGNADAGDAGTGGEGGGKAEEPYLGDWKTKEDAADGLKNLQTKLSEQGSKANALQAQVEESQTLMQEMQAKLQDAEKAKETNAADHESKTIAGEQAKIAQQIADLDPVDEGYSKNLMSLMNKSNALAAKKQHQATLAAATETFRKELDERDIRSTHQAFYAANPEFNTPEMQARIKEYIRNDNTGMTDPLVAFREIQRDDATAKMKELSDQNAEMQKLLDLKEGTGKTGTVIKEGQGSQGQQTKQPKTTGAERNQGMQAVLDKMKG